MRKIALVLLCTFLFIGKYNDVKAVRTYDEGPYLASFTILDDFLYQGKLEVNSIVSTRFTARFTLLGYGAPGPAKAYLVHINDLNEETLISEVLEENVTGVWAPTIQGVLPSGIVSGKVCLKYEFFSNNQAKSKLSLVKFDLFPPPAYEAPVSGAVPIYEYVSGNKIMLTTLFHNLYLGYTYGGIFGFAFNSQAPGTVPLYHYVQTSNGNNYYTTAQDSYAGYTGGDTVCYVYSNQVTKTLPVYQHYMSNTNGGYHLYANVPGIMTGYGLEGIRFYILQNKQVTTYPLLEEDCAELYRYYNTNLGDHYYTTSKGNYPGYNYETILGYISTIQKPGTVPLYRYWNESVGDHYYPLVQQNYTGYVYEGIVGYVYPTPGVGGTAAVYSYYNSNDGDHYYEMLNSNFNGYVNEGIRFYMLQYNH